MFTLGFTFLLYLSYKLPYNRFKASPAFVFTLTWLIIAIGVECVPYFHVIPIGIKGYILLNSFLFVCGCALGGFVPYKLFLTVKQKTYYANAKYSDVIICVVGMVLVFFSLSLLFFWIKLALTSPNLAVLFAAVRAVSLEGESIFNTLSYFHRTAPTNLFTFAVFLILTKRISGHWRLLIYPSIILSLFLTMLEGARSGFFQQLLSFATLYYVLGLINIKGVLKIGFFAVSIFLGTGMLMRSSSEDGIQGFLEVLNHIFIYVFAPTVAFAERYGSQSFHLEWPDFFIFLDKLGIIKYQANPESLIPPYLTTGTSFSGIDIVTNVFTSFAVVQDNFDEFAFLYWFAFGFIAALIHSQCINKLSVAIYSLILPAIILSIFSEYFLSNIIKTIRFIILISAFFSLEFAIKFMLNTVASRDKC